jgi:hypothetical protein
MHRKATLAFVLVTAVLAAAVGFLMTGARATFAQPTEIPDNAVCFYEDINYGGHYFMLYVDHDESDLRSINVGTDPSVTWNDKISSLKVGKNACVTFWQDINYRGNKGTYEANGRNVMAISSLVGPGWNDKISSLKVRLKGNCAKS